MTIIAVRNVGTYGFHTTPLNGIGLSTSEAATTRSDVEQALALADALRAAMRAARQAGLQAFAPAQAVAAGHLTLPPDLTSANRDAFFANIMGRAYAGGPVSLDQWSQAVEELEHWAGATASMLPPGAGGGTRNVRGTWYVNGQAWSLSELFTVNRVNTLSEIDRMVADSLNVIAANNEAAKAFTALMQKLFDTYYEMGTNDLMTKHQINTLGESDPNYPMSFGDLLAYANKHIGEGSMVAKLAALTPYNAPTYNNTTQYQVGDYVSYGDNTYRAKATNKGGSWSATEFYGLGDVVFNNGVVYQCTGYSNLFPYGGGITYGSPTTDQSVWTPVTAYSATTEYHEDDAVLYQGQYYKLIKHDKKPWFGVNYTLGINPSNDEFWTPFTVNSGSGYLQGAVPTNTTNWDFIPEKGLTKDDFRAMIDEVEQIIGAFSADNQVAQLRNETLFNSRSNLLEGLGTFLKGQQTTRSTLARNV